LNIAVKLTRRIIANGLIYVAANTHNMLFNPLKNTEQQLPGIPNGVRITYPYTAAAALLPLTVANNWTPEILFCGGSTINEKLAATKQSSATPASKQCARMALSTAGIKRGWQVEYLPESRVMGEAVLTPTGQVVILNGAQTGLAGYGNVKDVYVRVFGERLTRLSVTHSIFAAWVKVMPTTQLTEV